MHWIKKITVIIASLFIISFQVNSASDKYFHDARGNAISSSDFKGKWVIVNYWATWCDICMTEVPELNQFYKNNSKNVLLFGVNYDHLTSDDLRQAINSFDIKYPVLVEDPTSLWNFGYFDVVPVTFVINPQGKVVKRILGAVTDAQLSEIIRS